jgi:threonine aldolase
LIVGSHELMYRARIEKHRFGGAMRQAGIVAAAGVYALDHNVDRLADDHARARRLAEGWADAGLPVDLELVQTNFLQLDVASLGLAEEEAIARIREQGVLLSPTRPGVLRAVTSLEIDDDAIDYALTAVPRALEAVRV